MMLIYRLVKSGPMNLDTIHIYTELGTDPIQPFWFLPKDQKTVNKA